jgi:hypothetical protein
MVSPFAPSFAPTSFRPSVGYAGMNPAAPQSDNTGYGEEEVD